MSKRAALSEQELRRIISASLQAHHHSSIGHLQEVDAPVTQIEWEAPIPLDQIPSIAELDYLIEAFNQFSPADIVISGKRELPTDEKSPMAIKSYLSAKAKTYGFSVPTWPGGGTLAEQQQVAFDYIKLFLKCKIIDLLNDVDNKTNPRFVFFIGDKIYLRDTIDPKTLQVIDELASKLNVTDRKQFNSLDFFSALDDKNFVDKISNPDTGKAEAGPLKNPNPTAFYIDDDMAKKFNELIQAAVNEAFDKASTLINQFDTDYVESFFCTPLVYPDTWKRYCFDDDHPLATPWRQSYVVMNVASQAGSVAGGAIALYSKLMSFYTGGSNIQPGEKTSSQDPFVTTGMFTSLNESKKILVTLGELRRIIDAALLTEITPVSTVPTEPGAIAKTWQFVKGIFKSDPEIERAAGSAALRGFKQGAKYADDLKKLVTRFPALSSELNSVLFDAAGNFDKTTLKAALNTVIKPTGAGEEVLRAKEVLVDTIADIAERVAMGENLDAVMLKVIGSEGSDILKGDLSLIQNWSLPLRDSVARMITQSANGEILTGQASVDELSKLLQAKAATIASNLQTSLIDGVNIPPINSLPATGRGGRAPVASTLSFNRDRRRLISTTAGGTETVYDLADPKKLEEVRNRFGEPGAELFQNSVEYVTQYDALGRDAILIDGVETPVGQIAAKYKINSTITGVPDALLGAVISPNKARKVARAGEFEKHSNDIEVTIDKLDSLKRSGKAAEMGLYRGDAFGGKFKRTILPKNALSLIYVANRAVLGAPVRGTARAARALFGDANVFGKFADLLATSGFYSTLVGLVTFNYLAGLASSKTPGKRSQDFAGLGLFGFLDAIIPDGPLNLGLLNFMLEGFAAAVNNKMSVATDLVKSCFTNDPLAAFEGLSDALRAYYVKVDVSPLRFPSLTTKNIDAGYRSSVAKYRESMGKILSRVSAFLVGDDTSGISAAADKAVADADVVLTELTKSASAGATTGNNNWRSLEASRKSASDEVLTALQTSSQAQAGESQTGISGYQSVLTQYFTPTAETATLDPATDAIISFSSWLVGAEADVGDFAELSAWFNAAATGKTPSLKLGVKNQEQAKQVGEINEKLKTLAEKYYQMTTLADARAKEGSTSVPAAAPSAPAATSPQ